MKVHFITSRPTLMNEIKILRRIVQFVRDEKYEIADDWIEIAYKRLNERSIVGADWEAIFKHNLEVIARCDVVIAEASFDSFGVGYQIAFAVQQRKPILLLRNEASDANMYVTGVKDRWITHEMYNDENVIDKVRAFLNENDIHAKDMRFNFFIDRKIYNYLRWASFRTGKTKAEILRNLVEAEIDRKDLTDK